MCRRLAIGGVFFFQAEDGIRDLVRSRGLGDVYKRQDVAGRNVQRLDGQPQSPRAAAVAGQDRPASAPLPVSYTHLTLPTSDLV